MVSMFTATPGHNCAYRSKYRFKSTQPPSPIAVHCTLQPLSVCQMRESRKLVVMA